MIVGLIPARGGSKGIPRKNIKLLNGKPLIWYTIQASLNSKFIDRTIVSTDDAEIAKISKDCGAEVPFLRPASLAKDDVLDFPVIEHSIQFLLNNVSRPKIIVYLRPTMPFRDSTEIDKVINLLLKKENVDGVQTTRPVPYSPYWMKKVNRNGDLEPYDEHIIPFSKSRRQDLPKVVMCDGYVDAVRSDAILSQNKFPPDKTYSFFRDDKPYIDIDNMNDWNYCEYHMKRNMP